MPEWYLVNIALALLGALSFAWKPLVFFLPLFLLTAGPPLISVIKSVSGASFTTRDLSRFGRLKLQFITALLHIIQPVARLYGRFSCGLTPWRRRGTGSYKFPWPRSSTLWSEKWQATDTWLKSIEAAMRSQGAIVRSGDDWDRWELEVRGGLLGRLRMRMAVEEHGGGKQLLRLRSWPRVSLVSLTLTLLLSGLSILAGLDQAWIASSITGLAAIFLALGSFKDCAAATGTYLQALAKAESGREDRCRIRVNLNEFSSKASKVAQHRNPVGETCSFRIGVAPGDSPFGEAWRKARDNEAI
jgi:hypothetical protein